jgi:hypothetical protein
MPDVNSELAAARDGAIELVSAAHVLAQMLDLPQLPAEAVLTQTTVRNVLAAEETTVGNLLADIKRLYERLRVALETVAPKLNAARKNRGPVRMGKRAWANGHDAALWLCLQVGHRIQLAVIKSGTIREADPQGWDRFLDGRSGIGLDPAFVIPHLAEIQEHFDGSDLPAADELIAEIRLESAAALEEMDDPREKLPDEIWIGLSDLAEQLNLSRKKKDALRKRVDTWRVKNPKGNGRDWFQVPDPGPRDDRFVYRLGAIRHLL